MDDFSRLKIKAIQFDPSRYETPELAARVGNTKAVLIADLVLRSLGGGLSPDYEGFIGAQRRAYERSCEELARRTDY